MISQKRKHIKSNNNCKSKGNVYIFKLKFYPQQSFVNFRFHSFDPPENMLLQIFLNEYVLSFLPFFPLAALISED